MSIWSTSPASASRTQGPVRMCGPEPRGACEKISGMVGGIHSAGTSWSGSAETVVDPELFTGLDFEYGGKRGIVEAEMNRICCGFQTSHRHRPSISTARARYGVDRRLPIDRAFL